MSITNNLDLFIQNGDFGQESIDSFLASNNLNDKQLIARSFRLINSYINKLDENNTYCEILNNIINLISLLCERNVFSRKEIDINRTRIKKYRESLLSIATDFDDYDLLTTANKLDEMILDKNLEVNDLILLIKQLIDRKEDVNIIKKIVNINKKSILDNDELFDYTFNLAIRSIKEDKRDKFYYITLLKIFYSSKLDTLNYLRILNNYFNPNNKFANEIYMIIFGVKRFLTTEEILNKYEIVQNPPYTRVFVPKRVLGNDHYLLTIDDDATRVREDAISIKKDGSLYVVGIHISDTASIIEPNSDVDLCALNNFQSKFLFDGNRTRLFHKDVEKRLSLNESAFRPLLSLYVIINDYGEVKDYYFKSNDLLISRNLTYQKGDNLIDNRKSSREGQMLYDLYKIARALESKNIDRLKYWDIKNLSSKDLSRNTKSDIIVRQCMILYNHLAAILAREQGFPFTYRVQGKEYISYLIKELNIKVNDYTSNLIKEIYLEGQYSDVPNRHNGLNLDCYGQATDTLRKYPDFYNQQLLHRFLLQDFPYDFDETIHKQLISYFNQRAEELSLMASEYNREMKLTRK